MKTQIPSYNERAHLDRAYDLMWKTDPPFPYSEIEYCLLRSIAISLIKIQDLLLQTGVK